MHKQCINVSRPVQMLFFFFNKDDVLNVSFHRTINSYHLTRSRKMRFFMIWPIFHIPHQRQYVGRSEAIKYETAFKHRPGAGTTPLRPARPIEVRPHSTGKAATRLSGQRKPADTFSPHSASVNWILKYNLSSVRYRCGVILPLPPMQEGLGVFHMEREGGVLWHCESLPHTHTHIYTTHGIWPRGGFYLTFTVPEVRL